MEIRQEGLHHGVDYTPFEGMRVTNWPRWTVLRGRVVWDRDGEGIVGEKGKGWFLRRGLGMVLTGRRGGEGKGMLKGETEFWT